MYQVGDRVRVNCDVQNDNYDDFLDKTLIVTAVYYNTWEHPGYDDTMAGMGLYSLDDEDGNEIPCDLYEYELEDD